MQRLETSKPFPRNCTNLLCSSASWQILGTLGTLPEHPCSQLSLTVWTLWFDSTMSEETFTEGVNNLAKKSDGTLALVILAVAVVVVIAVGIYMLKNRMFSSGADIRYFYTFMY